MLSATCLKSSCSGNPLMRARYGLSMVCVSCGSEYADEAARTSAASTSNDHSSNKYALTVLWHDFTNESYNQTLYGHNKELFFFIFSYF